MSLLDDLLPGQVWDPSVLARLLPGTAPDPVPVAQAGGSVEKGVAYVPTPGPPGRPGEPGEPGIGEPGPPGPPGDLTQKTDRFLVTIDGPQTLHLTRTPAGSDLSLFINGLRQNDLSDAQISGAVISLGLVWQLFAGDTLAVQYGYLP